MTRAKFQVVEKVIRCGNYYDTKEGSSSTRNVVTVVMSPVVSGSDENKEFFANTPSGKIEIGVLRQELADLFEIGKEYYVDFSQAA